MIRLDESESSVNNLHITLVSVRGDGRFFCSQLLRYFSVKLYLKKDFKIKKITMTATGLILLGVGSRVKHPAFGEGAIVCLHLKAYEVCFMLYGVRMVAKDYDSWSIIEALPAESAVTFTEAENALKRILRTWSDVSEIVPLGDKWENGTMILKPADEKMKPKEIPIDAFFHKIVMVRDRIRVMEQRINASAISDEEKVNLQQYITRIYGSLTTFNVLFKNKEQQFVGDKGE